MRPILTRLFALGAKQRNQAPSEEFFEKVYPKSSRNLEFYDLLKELVGVKENDWMLDYGSQTSSSPENTKQMKKVSFPEIL